MTTTTRSAAKRQGQKDGAPPADEARPGSKHKAEESSKPPSPKRPKKESQKTPSSEEKKEKPTKEPGSPEGEAPDIHEKQQGSPSAPADAQPASILEKGIIYFFFRGRVNVDEPSSVSDIARSYIILRPLAKDARLGSDGSSNSNNQALNDAGTSRICIIPKKTLPQSGRDRWIGFVEKAGASFKQLKDEFLASADYQTKTAGERHTPAATPVGEGVYVITSTGRESHLAYKLTLPAELGEVQREIGLREEGSFILSTKNPEHPGPANARLPKAPEYPKGFFDEFRSLRWVPTQPKHLDYANTQFLLVGESSGLEKALEQQKEDAKEGKAEPAEEMEKLEDEDTQRMQKLSEDDSSRIFADLKVDAQDYPKLQTTFS